MAIGYEASVQTRCVMYAWSENHFETNDFWIDISKVFKVIDNAKKGELFGINNIFKLHEDKLATKMAVSYFSVLKNKLSFECRS